MLELFLTHNKRYNNVSFWYGCQFVSFVVLSDQSEVCPLVLYADLGVALCNHYCRNLNIKPILAYSYE